MDPKKLDLKQIGGGAGATVLILFLAQDRGIDFMSQKYEAQNRIAIEKAESNARNIEQLNIALQNVDAKITTVEATLGEKIEKGFSQSRAEMRSEVTRLSDIILRSTVDSYSRQDHMDYSKTVRTRIDRLEDRLNNVENDQRENK